VLRSVGEHGPAALAMAGALALQAMMLGLPHASSAESDIFWRVRTFLLVSSLQPFMLGDRSALSAPFVVLLWCR